jgi:hypothetical protein
MRFRYGSDKGISSNFCANLGRSVTETSVRERQHEPYMESSYSLRPKWGETGEEQSQQHAHRFIWHQGDCSQRIRPGMPNSQFRILLWRLTATAWKYEKTSLLILTTKRTGCCITATHHLTFPFHQGTFDQKQDCRASTQPIFSLFPWWKTKLRDRHFYTLEVIEAESQVMLNSRIEYDFQDAFKKLQKSWERCMRVKGDYFEDDDGQ